MESFFSAEFFANNRANLKNMYGGLTPIVITANGLLQRSGDTTFPFRQDSSFWYLTGINEPDIVLIIDKLKEYLIVPQRDRVRTIFDGAVNPELLKQRSGIGTVLEGNDGWKQLITRLKQVHHVATLAPAAHYVSHYGMYTNPARAGLVERLKIINPDMELLNIAPHVTRLRMVKQSAEIAAIQAAVQTTVTTIKQVSKNLEYYKYEYELEAEVTRGFRKQGAIGHAYEPVIAYGKNACTLHYVANNGKIGSKGLVLIDVGAEIEHYAADITRTYPITRATKRQRAVLKVTKEIQAFAFAQLGPGVTIKSYEQTIEKFAGEKLRELGLIKIINHDSVRQYYPHATSHYLGLDVHDAADYNRPLEQGMVLTVEPGVYIPQESIGVRIEDDVLITEKGIKVLSRHLPLTAG